MFRSYIVSAFILVLLLGYRDAESQMPSEIYQKVFNVFCDSIAYAQSLKPPCEDEKDRHGKEVTIDSAISISAKYASKKISKEMKKDMYQSNSINNLGRRFSVFAVFFRTPMLKSPETCEIIFISDEAFFTFAATFRKRETPLEGAPFYCRNYKPFKFKRINASKLFTSIEWMMYTHFSSPQGINTEIFSKEFMLETHVVMYLLQGEFKNDRTFHAVGLKSLKFYKNLDWMIPRLEEP